MQNNDLSKIKQCLTSFDGSFLLYSPKYKQLTGDTDTALLLAQLIFYWCSAFDQKEFWRKDETLEKDLGVSRFTLNHCRKKLIDLGFVEIVRKGENNRNFYTVNTSSILEALKENEKPLEVPATVKKQEEKVPGWKLKRDEKEWTVDDKCEFLFDQWNSYKGLKKDGKSWCGHRKLTTQMRQILKVALKEAKLQDDLDVAVVSQSIENYVSILRSSNTFWNHFWILTEFFSVRHSKERDNQRKWWQFMPENFNFDKYLKFEDEEEKHIPAHNPEVMELMLAKYRKLIGNGDFDPDWEGTRKFAEACNFIEGLAQKKDLSNKEMIKLFFQYLRYEVVQEQGIRIHPGTLNSSNTQNQFPQYLKQSGFF